MSLQNEHKIKNLMQEWPQGTTAVTAWLERFGISRQLLNRYHRSGWITRLGTGAYQKTEDDVNWQGGLYALQTQADLPIHVGAMTALSMQGLAHYLRLGQEVVFLFSPRQTKLPAWFSNHNWSAAIFPVRTSFLLEALGLMEYEEKTFTIRISTPERAILECLYLAPSQLDLMECYQVLEGLANLRPELTQDLLEACTSIRVKRLFLFMAEKAAHQWFPFLDTSRLELGSGDRSIVNGGVYVSKHRITVPKELAAL